MTNNREFRFLEKSHQYYLGMAQLPSVTTILSEEGLTPAYSQKNDFHRRRGSAIHKMLQLTIAGQFDFDATAPAVRRFHRGIVQYLETEMPKMLVVEKAGYHEPGWYAGTIDQVTEWRDGSLAIVDAKSSDTANAPAKSTAYQTAAYALMAAMMKYQKIGEFANLPPIDLILPKVKRFGLLLWPDDQGYDICYKLTPYNSDHDYNVWRAALTLNHAKKGRR
jgi:hypothetical protein